MNSSRATVSVIIVNYNGRHLLEDCLPALEAQTRAAEEVVLVDNGSSDDSISFVRSRFPHVRVIDAGENKGFAAGNNLGIEQATGSVIVLLNNDTVPGPGFIESIIRPLESDPDLSAVAGILLFQRNPSRIASAGIDVHADGLALDHRIGESWKSVADNEGVFGASGGAAAFRRDALDDVGLLEESFFLYLEDVDLAWRLRLRSHRTIAAQEAWALHAYSASSSNDSPLKDFHIARNRPWTLIRCWPAWLWRRYWWNVLRYEFLAIGYGILTRNWSSLSGRIRGWGGAFGLRDERLRIQRQVTVSEAELLYWVRPSNSVRGTLSIRQRIRFLSSRNGAQRSDNGTQAC